VRLCLIVNKAYALSFMDKENEEGVVTPENNEGEGKVTEAEVETISIPKKDYENLNQTLGSLKRELKDLKKPKEETKETPEKTQPDDSRLLEKAFLRSAGISTEEEVELALSTAKKWDMSVDKLVDDEDFKIKLEKLRTQKANELATSNLKGSGGQSQAKDTPEYWIAKGSPPSRTDVPNRVTRTKIARAMIENQKSGKKFYND